MKLHLTKSLRTALLACVCGSIAVASQATAELANLPNAIEGYYWLNAGTDYELTSSANNVSALIQSTGTDTVTGLYVAEEETITLKQISQHGYSTAYDWGYTKLGEGTLIVSEAPIPVGNGGRKLLNSVTVEAGTLRINYADFNATNVSVQNTGSVLDFGSRTQTIEAPISVSNGGTVAAGEATFTQVTLNNGNMEIATSNTNKGSIVLETTTGESNSQNAITGNTHSALRATVTGTGDLTLGCNTANTGLDVRNTLDFDGSLTINDKVNLKAENDGMTGTIGTKVDSITISSGATLNVETANALGTNDSSNIKTITLKGDNASSVATLNLSAKQELVGTEKAKVNINLNGNTLISGSSGSLVFQSAIINATGTNNEISTSLTGVWDTNLNVAEYGELTLSGKLNVGKKTNAPTENADGKVNKTGLGTLKIASDGVIAEEDKINLLIEEGSLDLSNVTTLNAEELYLAADATLIMGTTPLTMTGTLKVQSGAIIDLSSWGIDAYQFDDELLFQGVDNLVFTDADGNVLNDEYGYIKIDFTGDGTGLWDYWLYDAGNGNINAIPEPTTATLSLLALAGLAARRRRK